MRVITMIVGIAFVFGVLLDAFQTIILPRRASGRRPNLSPRRRPGSPRPWAW